MGKVGEWLVATVYLAMIFVMVRPGSQGPSLVTAIGSAISAVTNAATGGGTWSDGSTSSSTTNR
jgi:hypothetical protein